MQTPNLTAALAAAGADYFRLVLLVGPPGTGKTRLLREHATAGGHPLLSVGRPTATRLLELPERQRPRRTGDLVADLITETGADASVVLLDDLELLFAPSLALDPLRLLQSLARNRTIVAAWPGEFADGTLTYADVSHPEHRVYRTPEAVIVLAAGAHAPVTA